MRLSLYISIVVFFILFQLFLWGSSARPPNELESTINTSNIQRRYVFATLLSVSVSKDTNNVLGTAFVQQVRVMLYRLYHDERSKMRTHIPFIVLVTKDIDQDTRDTLSHDGATIQEVERILPNWIKPGEKYKDQFAKLHLLKKGEFVFFFQKNAMVFDNTTEEYDLICYLDADTLITRRGLEDVFTDPATIEKPSKSDVANIEGEGPPPASYVFAGQPEAYKLKHILPLQGNYLNGGFWIVKPSISMFEYYMKILNSPNHFNAGFMEQALFNYVHRNNGSMPWARLKPMWNVNYATVDDLIQDVITLHWKQWSDKDEVLKKM